MNKNTITYKYKEIMNELPEMVSTSCSVCGNEDGWEVYKTDFGIIDAKIWCNKCGLIYQKHRWTDDNINAFYKDKYITQYVPFAVSLPKNHPTAPLDHHEFFYWFSFYRKEQVNAVADILKESETILDLGCGSGGVLHHITKINKNAIGTDLSSDSVAYARKMGLNAEMFDITKGDRIFETIFCSNVIEHIPHPRDFLNGVEISLKNNGSFIVVVPDNNIEPEIPHVPHIYNFTKKSLIQMIEENSLLRFSEARTNVPDKWKHEMILVFKKNNAKKTYPVFLTSKNEYEKHMKPLSKAMYNKIRRHYDKSRDIHELRELKSLYSDLPKKYKTIWDSLFWSKLYRVFTFKKTEK